MHRARKRLRRKYIRNRNTPMRIFVRQIFPSLSHEPASCISYQVSNRGKFPSDFTYRIPRTLFPPYSHFAPKLRVGSCGAFPFFPPVLATRFPESTSKIALSSTMCFCQTLHDKSSWFFRIIGSYRQVTKVIECPVDKIPRSPNPGGAIHPFVRRSNYLRDLCSTVPRPRVRTFSSSVTQTRSPRGWVWALSASTHPSSTPLSGLHVASTYVSLFQLSLTYFISRLSLAHVSLVHAFLKQSLHGLRFASPCHFPASSA